MILSHSWWEEHQVWALQLGLIVPSLPVHALGHLTSPLNFSFHICKMGVATLSSKFVLRLEAMCVEHPGPAQQDFQLLLLLPVAGDL